MKAVKQTVRKYYKYQTSYISWTRPNLTANGTIGGDSYGAVAISENGSGQKAFQAFDSSSSTYWCGYYTTVPTEANPQWITFYSPVKIKVSSVTFSQHASDNYSSTKGYVYGSDDNSTWVQIGSWNNPSAPATINVTCTTNTAYKYIRFSSTGSYGIRNWELFNIAINAQEEVITIVESTSQDYDFYRDVDEYKVPVISGTYYGVNQ